AVPVIARQPTATSTLFPYTTLFRSVRGSANRVSKAAVGSCFSWTWPNHCSVSHFQNSLPWTVPASNPSSPRACPAIGGGESAARSEEHTSELQSRENLVCRLLLETK